MLPFCYSFMRKFSFSRCGKGKLFLRFHNMHNWFTYHLQNECFLTLSKALVLQYVGAFFPPWAIKVFMMGSWAPCSLSPSPIPFISKICVIWMSCFIEIEELIWNKELMREVYLVTYNQYQPWVFDWKNIRWIWWTHRIRVKGINPIVIIACHQEHRECMVYSCYPVYTLYILWKHSSSYGLLWFHPIYLSLWQSYSPALTAVTTC